MPRCVTVLLSVLIFTLCQPAFGQELCEPVRINMELTDSLISRCGRYPIYSAASTVRLDDALSCLPHVKLKKGYSMDCVLPGIWGDPKNRGFFYCIRSRRKPVSIGDLAFCNDFLKMPEEELLKKFKVREPEGILEVLPYDDEYETAAGIWESVLVLHLMWMFLPSWDMSYTPLLVLDEQGLLGHIRDFHYFGTGHSGQTVESVMEFLSAEDCVPSVARKSAQEYLVSYYTWEDVVGGLVRCEVNVVIKDGIPCISKKNETVVVTPYWEDIVLTL